MNMQDLQPTYTMRDMAKMFRRVDLVTRENNNLTRQLIAAKGELAQIKLENADLIAQLDDMQRDFIRQRTAAQVIPLRAQRNS
jgi:BMFP domain-containing protein YqiC